MSRTMIFCPLGLYGLMILKNWTEVQNKETMFLWNFVQRKPSYIGKVIEDKDCDRDFVVSFLRKSDKIVGKIVQPNVPDVTSMPEKDIKMILPQLVTLGFTKRETSLTSFEVYFWFINIK
ncbi:hypothetical protein AVEN_48185-1 [Araneus ventricosus]|uniref:Uncharacterized protein n=1 Tax=Araneus ventricosus TaxID=182803 RepID=A0A4Y2JAA5_ARAVE|nr:hypothetical protein AVEN_48185-1 [Araneus ventricosus]